VVDTRAGRGQPEKVSTLAALVGATRRRLWVTNAYFAPGMGSVELLGDAARRGVDVRLLLPGRSDVPLLKHAGHGYYADLLARGVRVFEYQPHTLHAKTIVADDYVSLIGSSNFDARSLHFNAECNVLILDEETGRAMGGAFERDLQATEEIDRAAWPKRGMLHRLGDGAARRLTPIL
jgi:cardiolipin synthase